MPTKALHVQRKAKPHTEMKLPKLPTLQIALTVLETPSEWKGAPEERRDFSGSLMASLWVCCFFFFFTSACIASHKKIRWVMLLIDGLEWAVPVKSTALSILMMLLGSFDFKRIIV